MLPHVSAALPIANWLPPKTSKYSGDSALFGGSEFGGFNAQRFARNIDHAHARERLDVGRDGVFPSVAFKSIVLLRANLLALKVGVRPPFLAGSVEVNRFREELIAIMTQRLKVDFPNFDRPKS